MEPRAAVPDLLPAAVRVAREGTFFLAQGSSGDGVSPKRNAEVRLPARASGSFRVVDDASGLGVEVRLEGARDVEGAEVSGLVAYPGGYEGADVLHRPTPDGTEDYLYFGKALPEKASVRYEVTLARASLG